jgi:hypothetical protein
LARNDSWIVWLAALKDRLQHLLDKFVMRSLSILFLSFESEERASNKSKAKYGQPSAARSGSELKLKTE